MTDETATLDTEPRVQVQRQGEAEEVVLSVVIIVVSSGRHLERCLDACLDQINAPPTEFIVPYERHTSEVGELAGRYPQVRFLYFPEVERGSASPHRSREHLDILRSRGLAACRAGIVGFLEDHEWPQRDWSHQLMEAHRGQRMVVGGPVENGVDRLLNWAVYFSDFTSYQRPVREGPTSRLSDVNLSYKRQAIEAVRDAWADSFCEPVVNGAVKAAGMELHLVSGMVVFQQRDNLTLAGALLERYVWGRSYAGGRARTMAVGARLAYVLGSPLLPIVLIGRKIRDIMRKRRNRARFFRAFPVLCLLVTFWSFGELVGYMTRRATA